MRAGYRFASVPRPPVGPPGRPISPQPRAPCRERPNAAGPPRALLPAEGLGVSLLLRGGRAWGGSQGPARRTPQACSRTCASGSQVLLQERTARAGQVRGCCFKPEVRPCPPRGKRTLSKAAPSGTGVRRTRGLDSLKSPLLWERRVGEWPLGLLSSSCPQGQQCHGPTWEQPCPGCLGVICPAPSRCPPGRGEHRRSSPSMPGTGGTLMAQTPPLVRQTTVGNPRLPRAGSAIQGLASKPRIAVGGLRPAGPPSPCPTR